MTKFQFPRPGPSSVLTNDKGLISKKTENNQITYKFKQNYVRFPRAQGTRTWRQQGGEPGGRHRVVRSGGMKKGHARSTIGLLYFMTNYICLFRHVFFPPIIIPCQTYFFVIGTISLKIIIYLPLCIFSQLGNDTHTHTPGYCQNRETGKTHSNELPENRVSPRSPAIPIGASVRMRPEFGFFCHKLHSVLAGWRIYGTCLLQCLALFKYKPFLETSL